MPDFSAQRLANPHKPGSLMHQKHEITEDIRAVKRGDETDVTKKDLRWMKARRRDVRRQIREEVLKEKAAGSKVNPAFKLKHPSGVAAARG